METKIHILKHKDAKFSGYQLGVGFHMGRGTTSSQRDVDVLVAKGLCKDVTEGKKEDKVKDEKKKESEETEKKAGKSKAKEKK